MISLFTRVSGKWLCRRVVTELVCRGLTGDDRVLRLRVLGVGAIGAASRRRLLCGVRGHGEPLQRSVRARARGA